MCKLHSTALGHQIYAESAKEVHWFSGTMKNCILCSECICSVLKGRKERHVNVLHPKLIIISSLPNESSLQAVQRQIDLPLRNVVCPQLLVKRNSVQPKPRSNFGIDIGAETLFFKNFQKN